MIPRPTRQYACLTCRRRHQRCDSLSPKCTYCRSQGLTCDYGASRRHTELVQRYPRGVFGNNITPVETLRDSNSNGHVRWKAPDLSSSKISDLILKCQQFDKVLNALDFESLLEANEDKTLDWENSPLPWAVIAVGALQDTDSATRAQSFKWAENARNMFSECAKTLQNIDEALTASVWIAMFSVATVAGISASMDLAQALRLARIVGYDTLDSKNRSQSSFLPQTRDTRVVDQRRRTMWALLMLENMFGSCTGWHFGISNVRMSVDLASLPGNRACNASTLARKQELYELVQKASWVLGVILSAKDMALNEEELNLQAKEVKAARDVIDKLRNKTQTLLSSISEGGHIGAMAAWLMVMPPFFELLLLHPFADFGSGSGRLLDAMREDPMFDLEFGSRSTNKPEHICQHSAWEIMLYLHTASERSLSLIQNPLLGPVFFLANRIQTLSWYYNGDDTAKTLVDGALELLDAASTGWEALALKYKSTALYDFKRSPIQFEAIRHCKGSYTVGSACGI